MRIKRIARSLGRLSAKWLDPAFAYRREALKALQARCGYPASMAREVLDDLFSELTEKKLWVLLESEIGNPEVLDRFCVDKKNSRKVRAFGPEMITHIFSANSPNPSVVSVVLGLLAKSVNVAKVSREDSGLLNIYLKSLRKQDPALGAACRLTEGKVLEKSMQRSDAVIAYGGPESIAHFFKKTSPGQVFMPYGHRMSFGVYLKGAFYSKDDSALAEKTADDLWLMNQKGCLSPLVIFVQEKRTRVILFCEALIRALGKRAEGIGPSADHTAARLHALKNKNNLAWVAGGWQVLYEESALKLPTQWGGRTVTLKSFASSKLVIRSLRTFSFYLQAATLEGRSHERQRMAEALARIGFNRLCRAGKIQKPPLSWHHDGRMNLAPLLRWTDLEVRDGF